MKLKSIFFLLLTATVLLGQSDGSSGSFSGALPMIRDKIHQWCEGNETPLSKTPDWTMYLTQSGSVTSVFVRLDPRFGGWVHGYADANGIQSPSFSRDFISDMRKMEKECLEEIEYILRKVPQGQIAASLVQTQFSARDIAEQVSAVLFKMGQTNSYYSWMTNGVVVEKRLGARILTVPPESRRKPILAWKKLVSDLDIGGSAILINNQGALRVETFVPDQTRKPWIVGCWEGHFSAHLSYSNNVLNAMVYSCTNVAPKVSR